MIFNQKETKMKRNYAYLSVLAFATVLALGACSARNQAQGPMTVGMNEPAASTSTETAPPAE